jgi:hypothetical protein
MSLGYELFEGWGSSVPTKDIACNAGIKVFTFPGLLIGKVHLRKSAMLAEE